VDEKTLRALLDDALGDEPPLGPVAHNALRTGIRLRRRREAWTVSGVALVAAVAFAIPAVNGTFSPNLNRPPALTGRVTSGGGGMGGHGDRPQELAFTPNGRILATADTDGSARLWNVATQRQIGKAMRISGAQMLDVAVSPGGTMLATAESDGTARLWSIATQRQIGAPFQLGRARVLGVAFSPNGKIMATAGSGGSARLWEIATRREMGSAMTPPGGVDAVTFSPDGKLLATIGGRQNTVRFWNVATQRQVGRPIVQGVVTALAFSPNGKLLATVGFSAQIWSLATHRKIGWNMNTGLTDSYGVAFTPDGKILVTTDTDGTIRQWSVATHHQVRPVIAPKGHPEFLLEALSPSGTILATTQFAGPARLWNLVKPR
jgi:WD40 repeat protein